ncbi:molecular chaperone DnaK [Photobacterium damselae]|uniref:molecular chaperone DnaK n=1 Tax=Photobacterium damselae TaxID=38293 RepID=UPI00084A3858|nr:molecular chaperone DnaK [Photobacterium damselae]OEC84053.1 molecular chaperone DnaK [Photobacterium damselae subsp. damselae]
MDTKLVNRWCLDNEIVGTESLPLNRMDVLKRLYEREVELFVNGSSEEGLILSMLNCVYKIAESQINTSRWLSCTDGIFLDKKAGGYWLIEDDMSYIGNVQSGGSLNEVNKHINYCLADPINDWMLPSEVQLKWLYGLDDAPFAITNDRPKYCDFYLCTDGGTSTFRHDLDLGRWGRNGGEGFPIPFLPSSTVNKEYNGQSLLRELISKGFIPRSLKGEYEYHILLKCHTVCNGLDTNIDELDELLNAAMVQEVSSILLNEDYLRADTLPLHQKVLTDTELGHWSLWQDELDINGKEEITLNPKLVARDPKSSINDGVVAIDFGTKSTVVVYQKDNINIHPMRIGTGDLSKKIASHHYENPTIMEFINLESFTTAYNAKANKPYTRWNDLTISHTAQNSLQGSESSKFNTFLDEIKQWAGDKNRKLKIVGQHGKVIDLPPFLELTDDDFNPIEIYAYYLGLYINNMNNGIFLDYILSFPVTYEMTIRDKIIGSFEKGLKKSLPAELGVETINELTVTKGASEPAAYALTALQQYGFEPEGDERVFYGVFDFGGGTTDFDFGIYSEPTDRKDKRRFDYVIEHFGAGGDKFLGGENLLELLAFEIFKKNKIALLEKGIQFEKHPEKDAFAGSEQLLSNSQEARMNTKQLCISLRPFWEEHEDFSFDASGELSVTLTDVNGIQHSAFALDIDEEELNKILSDRIEQGVENFFDALRLAFSNSRLVLTNINNVQIFLAGNSSQSSFVNTLFKKHIAIQNKEMGIPESESRFDLFAPLGADKDDVEKPTGKTGVAFGLIESREGGSVKVVDHNIADEDVRFKYYLGESRKKKFKPLIDREVKFNEWNDFIDANYDTFEIFLTDQPSSSTGQISIGDSSIKKKVVKLDVTDEDALVYIRVVSPTAIEYVVAHEEGIANEQYLNDIKRIEL